MLDRAHLIPCTGRIPDSTQQQTYAHRTNPKASYIPFRTERGKKY